jgi:hypothetical protein
MSEIIHVPFQGDDVLTVEVGGKAHVILKPALEMIGLDFDSQRQKLGGKSWATTVLVTAVAEDGRARQMLAADVRTFLMLLATIDERRVAEHVRPKLVAYQREVADVIAAHFNRLRGGPEEFAAFTWTLDETCAIIRQRYHLHHNVVTLGRLFRTAGIWKQNGTPTAAYVECFHFTGTAWTVMPIGVARIAKRILRVTHQLQQSYAIQMRLELEGVGEHAPEQLRTDEAA